MKKLLLTFIAILLFSSGFSQSITRLIGVSPFQDSLWVFDTVNFNVIRRLGPTMPGFTITGMNGLARHPITNEIYIICKVSGVSGRVLGKLDPLTAVVTQVGNLGDNFSSITFNSSGTLYGVTGDGAAVSETAYIINPATASKTLLRTLGNGADGEVICFNPSDNMIYHWSGNGTVVFEKFDTSGVTVTNIPISGSTNGETFGMVHLSGNDFLGSNISSGFQHWNANGTVSPQVGATTPDDIRGTVLNTCPRVITGTPAFCIGDSTLLTMASPGAASYQWYKDGVPIPGAVSQTYYASAAGYYNCFIIDACGTDSLAPMVHVVRNSLPVVAVSGSGILCPSSSTTLTGTSGGTLQWYLNGSPIGAATSSTYMATAPGVYNMVKTNLNGCHDSAAVGITVTGVPAPTVDLGNDTAFCMGGMLTLDAMNAGSSYLWTGGSTSQTLMVMTSGIYDVAVTDANGCIGTDSVDITVNPLPVVDLGADTAQCGGTIMLDAQNAGASYLWSDGTTTRQIVISAPGTYSVTVTAATGCEGTDTVMVTINAFPAVSVTSEEDTLCTYSAPVTLTTSPAGGMLVGTGVSGSDFDPSAGAGTYYPIYTYTDANGCSAADSTMIFVDICTGIATASNTVISVYPNPAGNELWLDLSSVKEQLAVVLYDITGKSVINRQLTGGSTEKINLSDVSKGIYILRIRDHGTLLFNERVVVTH